MTEAEAEAEGSDPASPEGGIEMKTRPKNVYDLRKIVNAAPELMATPGAAMGEAVYDLTKASADAEARVHGVEQAFERDDMREEQTETQHGKGLAQKKELAEAGMETQEEMHLADVAGKRQRFGSEMDFEREMLAEGKTLNDRATLISLVGTAVNMGSTAVRNKAVSRIIDRYTAREGALDELDGYRGRVMGKLLEALDLQIDLQKNAFTKTGD